MVENFSDAVNPRPAITIYIMLSNKCGVMVLPKNISHTKATAQSMKAENVTTRLELQESLWPSLNRLLRNIIIALAAPPARVLAYHQTQ